MVCISEWFILTKFNDVNFFLLSFCFLSKIIFQTHFMLSIKCQQLNPNIPAKNLPPNKNDITEDGFVRDGLGLLHWEGSKDLGGDCCIVFKKGWLVFRLLYWPSEVCREESLLTGRRSYPHEPAFLLLLWVVILHHVNDFTHFKL